MALSDIEIAQAAQLQPVMSLAAERLGMAGGALRTYNSSSGSSMGST